jgi:hypothetical protein
MHGQEILIDQILIHEELGICNEGTIDVINATYDKAKTILKNIANPHAFVENEQCNTHERGISCEICNHFANHLLMREVNVLY